MYEIISTRREKNGWSFTQLHAPNDLVGFFFSHSPSPSSPFFVCIWLVTLYFFVLVVKSVVGHTRTQRFAFVSTPEIDKNLKTRFSFQLSFFFIIFFSLFKRKKRIGNGDSFYIHKRMKLHNKLCNVCALLPPIGENCYKTATPLTLRQTCGTRNVIVARCFIFIYLFFFLLLWMNGTCRR